LPNDRHFVESPEYPTEDIIVEWEILVLLSRNCKKFPDNSFFMYVFSHIHSYVFEK
jgi:hypothetical protein